VNVWLPYIAGGSGTDVFTDLLARGLRERGHVAVTTEFAHRWQYLPYRLLHAPAPRGTEFVVANLQHAFFFRRPETRLVAIEHHCVLDPAYAPFRSRAQALYHETLLRRFETAGVLHADAVVAVSAFTAGSVQACLHPIRPPVVITNGIDVDYFTPAPKPARIGTFKLLFVGNLIRRKGFDLLPAIMRELGPGFELRYTGGLRTRHRLPEAPNVTPLGHLDRADLLHEYREADVLLFPTRFEGFGYAAAEALACGTPVVTSRSSSLPEVVDHSCGRLCPIDDVQAFAAAVRDLAADRARLTTLGSAARDRAKTRFDYRRMIDGYCDLLRSLGGT
jgi:alpha-maltose-1-phosphate synthase